MADRLTATEAASRRYTRVELMEREFHYMVRDWQYRGLVRNFALESVERDGVLVLHLKVPFSSEDVHYRITTHELEMGGLDALRFWLGTIERELRHHYDHWRCSQRTMSVSPGRIEQIVDLAIGPDETVIAQMAQNLRDNAELALQRMAMQAFDAGFADAIKRPEAEKKSKELFIATAGKAAYATLESGAPWPITGSEGTPYHLFKRASYCIERPSDGARLCAVVPGVPLWDHLLGIKLMVENDEPTFLKTANVSGGVHVHDRYRQPMEYWFNE